jgi:putative transport protein
MIEFLARNPLLLLFITAAFGYAIGRIKVKGASLGVAAVLFVGLFIGSFSPELRLPDFTFALGLAIFVYTVGLSSGASFFASFRGTGLRDNVFILAVLILAAGMVYWLAGALEIKPGIATGVFAGSLTNTPALGAVLEAIRSRAPLDAVEALLAEPVVGYSVAYPLGVLVPILSIAIMSLLFRIDYRREAGRLKGLNLVEQEIYSITVEVTDEDATSLPLSDLMARNGWSVVFARLQREGALTLVDGATTLRLGDLVSIVGTPEQVDQAASALGRTTDVHLDFDRTKYDYRRIFASDSDVVGRKLKDLELPTTYDAIVTRIRRGDIDFIPDGNTVVELGDRVRVVANRERMKAVSDFFGDSYKHLSEIDLLTFGLGMSLGLLLGAVPIPLPGGVTVSLGSAGGPLVIALILGALRRTGPLVWTIPYSANLTLRQLGLMLLLATVGLKSGYTFVSTFATGGGALLLLMALIVSLTTSLLILLIGYKLLKIPYGMLSGMLASAGTQPATLGFALEQAKDESPNIGWSLVFPISMIGKIVLAQVLLTLLNRT